MFTLHYGNALHSTESLHLCERYARCKLRIAITFAVYSLRTKQDAAPFRIASLWSLQWWKVWQNVLLEVIHILGQTKRHTYVFQGKWHPRPITQQAKRYFNRVTIDLSLVQKQFAHCQQMIFRIVDFDTENVIVFTDTCLISYWFPVTKQKDLLEEHFCGKVVVNLHLIPLLQGLCCLSIKSLRGC